ncbi:hypothetical protein MBLNU459_g0966t1 [Dothideomycetes sp. NU459]
MASADPPPAQQKQPLHTLPSPFSSSTAGDGQAPILLTQGAEALVYRTHFLTPTTPCALKYRPPKPWRHRTLDQRLTRARILAEARVLARCRREGVVVPAVLALDWENGWLCQEWIRGATMRKALEWFRASRPEAPPREGECQAQAELVDLLARIGRAVGRLHETGVVHGDLTTSNIMLRPERGGGAEGEGEEDREPEPEPEISSTEGQVVLIDFGLATQSVQEEDKAVDLYVLERAFASTHPWAEADFKHVLTAYGESHKGGKTVLKRLEDVRMRGRKKSMLG